MINDGLILALSPHPVFVYRFITSETIEEKILHLQDTKKELFNTFVNDSNPLVQFSLDAIEQLL